MNDSIRKRTESWRETAGSNPRLGDFSDVVIRTITEDETEAKVLTQNLYLEGAEVVQCMAGHLRVTLDGLQVVEIGAGEILVVYPEHGVTLEALADANRFVTLVLGGSSVTDYLDAVGFYHGQTGRANLQEPLLVKIREQLVRTKGVSGPHSSSGLGLLTDILRSAAIELRAGGNPIVIDAIRLIRSGLGKGLVRLEPICRRLQVSRAHLHAAFVKAGMDPPSVFIRNEQIQQVLRLLRTTQLPVAEIARRTGFISMTHFANFMHRYTGKNARAWRDE